MPRRGEHRLIDPHIREQAVADYAAGDSLSAVARRYRTLQATLKDALQEAGIPIRTMPEQKHRRETRPCWQCGAPVTRVPSYFRAQSHHCFCSSACAGASRKKQVRETDEA